MSQKVSRVIIEFVGGYWDGMVIDSESSRWVDPSVGKENEFVAGVYAMTENGTVGKGFLHFVSPGVEEQLRTGERDFESFKGSTGNHRYVITKRIESDDGIWLQMEYSLRTHADRRE